MITIREIDWLAGILEGEGCFYYQQDSPAIQLTMTDLDIVQRAKHILKHTTFERELKPTTLTTKPAYVIRIVGNKAIGWMFTLYPLMGQRRRAKIKEIIAQWKSYKPLNGYEKHTNKITIINGEKICVIHGPIKGKNASYSNQYVYCLGCKEEVKARRLALKNAPSTSSINS
jgi:hypothetical protein